MKTATITWITHNNYGTMLQAFGLQQCLLQMGVQNDIICDEAIVSEPVRNQPVPKAVSCPQSSVEKAVGRINKYILHPAEFLISLRNYRADRQYARNRARYADYQINFEAFRKKHLRIAEGYARADMDTLNDHYDVFVCGSDQIWSVLDQNFDGYYYLDFVKKKKISYAPSVGTTQIGPERQKQIAQWLRDYSAVSVREKQSAEQLTALTRTPVEWVADPTLLHDREFWSAMSAGVNPPEKKYLLCYFLAEKPWYYEYARAAAKHLKLELILIPAKPEQMARKECCREPVGPEEFVSLIRHARYVLTDSYHGSIFSMLFGRNFTYLKRFADNDPNCQNIRIYSLFGKTGLTDRIVDEKEFESDDVRPIDYTQVDAVLRDFRKSSREFLHKAIFNT